MHELAGRIDVCNTPDDRVAFENEFRDTLFKIAARPLIELLLRVTLQLYRAQPATVIFAGAEGVCGLEGRQTSDSAGHSRPRRGNSHASKPSAIVVK